jgi:hypothetical protein
LVTCFSASSSGVQEDCAILAGTYLRKNKPTRQAVRSARWRGAGGAACTRRSPWWLLRRTAARTRGGGGEEALTGAEILGVNGTKICTTPRARVRARSLTSGAPKPCNLRARRKWRRSTPTRRRHAGAPQQARKRPRSLRAGWGLGGAACASRAPRSSAAAPDSEVCVECVHR